MDRKFTIFVSSTLEDLREQREAVIQTILEMGHFPVGMEMFSAADDEQWKVIRNQIDQSDYYLVIVAHRYGSQDASGSSYTEKEYDYACTKSIPTLGFVLDEKAQWPAIHMDSGDPEAKLNNFKKKVKAKLINFWTSTEELRGKVSIALTKQFNLNPRSGWVRAENAALPGTANELTRLSKENAELRERVAGLEKKLQTDRMDLVDVEEALTMLGRAHHDVSFYYQDSKDWENHTKLQLRMIFWTLAPQMMIETSISKAAAYLGQMFNTTARTTRSSYPIPMNTMKSVMSDLSTLGLVEPSRKRHVVTDMEEYWSLSAKGTRVLKRLRMSAMVANADVPEANAPAAPAVPIEDRMK